jgi:hypothetical protein
LDLWAQKSIKIAFWGDSRSNKDKSAENIIDILLHRITDWDFQLYSGDLTPGGKESDWQTALQFKGMDSLFISEKFFMCTSNHDNYDGDDYPDDYFYNKYTEGILPVNSLDSTTHFYYFRRQNVHVIACDAYLTDSTTMNNWLKQTLAVIPPEDWLISFWHNPCYSDITYKSSYLDRCGPWLEKIYDHGGDFILHGHAHVYVRTHPLLPDMTVDHNKGIVHIINGCGGASWREPQPQTEYTAFTPAETSFSCITFITFDSASAYVQTIDARPNQNLKVIDEWKWNKKNKN